MTSTYFNLQGLNTKTVDIFKIVQTYKVDITVLNDINKYKGNENEIYEQLYSFCTAMSVRKEELQLR